MSSCPNCGAYRHCYCTWSEKAEAIRIIKKRQAEERRKSGRKTVIEEERENERHDLNSRLLHSSD